MATLDPRIEVIREKFGLSKTDFWELPQRPGTWVAKHAALEVAAVKAGIVFDMPVVLEKDAAGLITSIVVQGIMDGRTEWSIGETNPSNYKVSGKQPSYPWAMSEKRAKDRVILKLIGIHGLVYSEDEMADDVRPPRQDTPDEPAQPKTLVKDQRVIWGELRDEIDACQSVEQLGVLWTSKLFQTEMKKLKDGWQTLLVEHKDAHKDILNGLPSRGTTVAPNFDALPQ